MKKITLTDVPNLHPEMIIAKYPKSGQVSQVNYIDEVENKSDLDLWSIISINLKTQEYELGRSILGLKSTNMQIANLNLNDLISGIWWTEVNTRAFSDERL